MDRQQAIESARGITDVLAKCNPTNDRHGLMDKEFCDQCAAFLARTEEPKNPLTLAEWKALREAHDYGAAFSRNILDAEDIFVFLFVLRDRLVHVAGCADMIISTISMVIDDHINPRTVEWVAPEA